MSIKKFLRSWVFYLNLVLIIGAFFVILKLTMTGIDRYTRHGETISTPDLRGLNAQQMKSLAQKYELKCVLIDSVYQAHEIPGTVIRQKPVAGYQLKEGRSIYVTVASHEPENIRMPKAVNMSLRYAHEIVKRAGLTIGTTKHVPSEYIDLVLEQRYQGALIDAGDYVPKGATIDFVVGSGLSNEETSIPNLSALNLDQVNERLELMSLELGVAIYDETCETAADSSMALVWKQTPRPESNRMVGLGTSINVWFTIDAHKIEVPHGFLNQNDSLIVAADSLNVLSTTISESN